MNSERVEAILSETHDTDPARRRRAVAELCPCHVRSNHDAVWERILELVSDSDLGVRRLVFHSMIDGSPNSRQSEIVEAIEHLRNDDSAKLRRQARKCLANYRRTGRINFDGVQKN